MQVIESMLSSSQKGLDKNPEWIHGVAREKTWASDSGSKPLSTTYHLGDFGQVAQPC